MEAILRHPAVVLAALGALSGTLGAYIPGFSQSDAPRLGLYMVLTGVWFGLVVAFGVWRWGNRSWRAALLAVVVTWVAWETAVNLALHIAEIWLKAAGLNDPQRTYVTGLAAGAAGAVLTWAGAAASSIMLRRAPLALLVGATGALFGLLLPWTNQLDSPLVLFVPWQMAVAGVLGLALAPQRPAGPTARAT